MFDEDEVISALNIFGRKRKKFGKTYKMNILEVNANG